MTVVTKGLIEVQSKGETTSKATNGEYFDTV